jgi:Enoyl-(Acyl carrier protein) reductase
MPEQISYNADYNPGYALDSSVPWSSERSSRAPRCPTGFSALTPHLGHMSRAEFVLMRRRETNPALKTVKNKHVRQTRRQEGTRHRGLRWFCTFCNGQVYTAWPAEGPLNYQGRAITERYVKEGAKVLIIDINEKEGREVEQATGAIFLKGDVTKIETWNEALELAKKKLGGLDIIIVSRSIIPRWN